MEPAIIFQENQTKIYLGKNKITPSLNPNFIQLHLVCNSETSSGYNIKEFNKQTKEEKIIENKFVMIFEFENIYPLEFIKEEILNGLQNIMYFENGGYLYVKKDF